MLNPELKQHIHESLLVPSKPSSYLLITPYHLFRLSFSSTELIDVPVRQAHLLWFHTPLGSLQGSTGAPSHLPPPCPPSAAHDFLPSYGDGGWGGRERPLTSGAGAEPMGGLQVLDASRVLAGDVDGGSLGRWCVKPRLTGGLSV